MKFLTLLPFLILFFACIPGCDNANSTTKVVPKRGSSKARTQKSLSTRSSQGLSDGLMRLMLAKDDERDASGKLISINLYKKDITLSDLSELEEAETIQRLHAGHADITDEDLSFLPKLVGLELLKLNVSGKITDAGLRHLAGLHKLRMLSVFYCPRLTGEGFSHLESLDKLEVLDIGNNKNIADENLIYLKELDSLQDLRASPLLGVTDEGLMQLSKVTQLKRLKIGSPNFTDQGLQALSGLKNLEQLSLRGCTNISDTGIENLRRSLSDCRIIRSR